MDTTCKKHLYLGSCELYILHKEPIHLKVLRAAIRFTFATTPDARHCREKFTLEKYIHPRGKTQKGQSGDSQGRPRFIIRAALCLAWHPECVRLMWATLGRPSSADR